MPKEYSFDNMREIEAFTQKLFDDTYEILVQTYGEQVLERMKQNIQDNIEYEIYETFLQTKVEGIIDFGDYLRSIEPDLSESPSVFRLGSTDENAHEIEFGRPPNATEPKDSDIIAWVRRKGIGGRSFIRVGQRIARYIRRHGIREKPAFRRGIDRTKGDQEEIANRTVEIVRSELGL